MNKQLGFTLVELLVTITILAILATISISIFFNLQKNSRDTKRKSDLATIQSGLEQYHADQGFYPKVINPEGSNQYYIEPKTPPLTLTSSVGNPTPPADIKTYLNVLPTNPVTTVNDYTYLPYPALCDNSSLLCNKYCLYTNAENIANANYAYTQASGYCDKWTQQDGSIIPGKGDIMGTNVGQYNYGVAAP